MPKKPTLKRTWVVKHDGEKFKVCAVGEDIPSQSDYCVCALPFTLHDAEIVANAIAQLPALLAAKGQ